MVQGSSCPSFYLVSQLDAMMLMVGLSGSELPDISDEGTI